MLPKAIITIKEEGLFHAIYCASFPDEINDGIGKVLKNHYNSLEDAGNLIAAGNIINLCPEGYFSYKNRDDSNDNHNCISYESLNDIINNANEEFIHHIHVFIDGAWEKINV